MSRLLLSLAILLSTQAGIFGSGSSTTDDPAIVVQARSVAKTDRLEAISILEDYLADGGDEVLLPQVALNAGEQRRLSGDASSARAHFRRVTEDWPGDSAADAASLGLALLSYEEGHSSGNAEATLSMVPDELVPDTMNADRYRILALNAAAAGRSEVEVRTLVSRALAFAEADPTTRARAQRQLSHLMSAEQAAELGDMPDIGSGDEQALAQARAALKADDFPRAIELARSLAATFPDSELLEEAEWVIKRAQAGDPFDARKIGVLLPLSGTYAPPGKMLRDALELAVGSGSGIKLIIKDTAGDPETAAAAFEELVLEEGVAAVIGPLLKDAAFPVAALAQDAQVPLVALTQAPGVTETGDWIFRSYLTYEQQVDALLTYSMGERQMQRFAILAPDSDYGRNTRDEFTRQVLERGGEVVRVVMYEPETTDMRKAAAQLGAKDYSARSGEFYRLKKEAEEKGMNPDKVVLPPLQDFDAIFVPDNYARVALVASALAYEEFAVGGFKPKRHDVAVPMLGLNGWNSPELAVRGGLPVQKCLFVDAFDVQDDDPAVQDFIADYRAAYGRPAGLIDAVGYDTGRLLSVASRANPQDREAFRAALASASAAHPVSRAVSFTEDRELGRQLYVFSVDSEGIYRAYPPSQRPDAPE
ncbi:MAG: penicillin-binding protein activator [Alphaproteobacteria bacterium]|nr:penicillin-binding protein activator [Alphaproteobacteria bacterium]